LFGAAEGKRRAIGNAVPPAESSEYARDVACARGAVSAEVFARATREGAAMGLEQAVAEALAVEPGVRIQPDTQAASSISRSA
jgi:hypothetical protein